MASTDEPEIDVEQAVADTDEYRLNLTVSVEDIGPCKKHVRVVIPQDDIQHFYGAAVDEMAGTATVPGFRVGKVPQKLVERRFRDELKGQVKQRLLIESLEQLSDDNELDPINEPDLDVDSIELPDEGDFEYEFDVEVRPEFELPDYEGLTIERPVAEVSDEDVAAYQQRFISQYGEMQEVETADEEGDFIEAKVLFEHGGSKLREISSINLELRPVLRFEDAELEGFDELMAGVKVGETRECDLTISTESENLEMRGETVHAKFTVQALLRLEVPEMDRELLQRLGLETEEELQEQIRKILERQAVYEQRQAARAQVLDKITESATWELPEQLVLRQTENALRREMLEMQQAGFTTHEIRARENEIRQRAVSTTRQALKEHFVLDKIATNESIEVTQSDLDAEIQLMAMQSGESARRVRARMIKNGMIDNLEAQVRERMAIDLILEKATFVDQPAESKTQDRVFAVAQSVCAPAPPASAPETDDEEGDDE